MTRPPRQDGRLCLCASADFVVKKLLLQMFYMIHFFKNDNNSLSYASAHTKYMLKAVRDSDYLAEIITMYFIT